jgi:hypothetical protein
MTQVGRERSDSVVDVFAVAIPAQESPTGKAVTHIVDPGVWPLAIPSVPSQGITKFPEPYLHPQLCQGSPIRIKEEGLFLITAPVLITSHGVAAQRSGSGRMQGYEPGSFEFGVFDLQNATFQVDVLAGEVQRFGDPQTRGGQKTEERSKGQRPQFALEFHPTCGGQQLPKLPGGVNVRSPALYVHGHQTAIGYFGTAVPHSQVASETADGGQLGGTVSLRVLTHLQPPQHRSRGKRSAMSTMIEEFSESQ